MVKSLQRHFFVDFILPTAVFGGRDYAKNFRFSLLKQSLTWGGIDPEKVDPVSAGPVATYYSFF